MENKHIEIVKMIDEKFAGEILAYQSLTTKKVVL